MKRKLLFLVSLLTTSMLLSACDLGGNGDNGGDASSGLPSDDSSGGGSGSSGGGATFNGDQNEAINKLYQLGSTQGFELTIKTMEDDGEEAEETFGFKSDIFWIKEDAAYQNVANGIDYYDYDSTKQSYDYEATLPPQAYASLNELVKQFTSEFYIGYQMLSDPAFAGSITAENAITFLGRGAKEYTYSYAVMGNEVSYKIIFDTETGITLKVLATASTADGGESFAQYEITSFKTGDQVVPPRLNKSSGQGGEGGQGEVTGDVFSNKLLMYVSNESANVYANSQLALFADGKFELSFLQAGYQVVIFGAYTVAASKSSATLVTEKVYKDQGKQTSAMVETWTLAYADGAYQLSITGGKVNYIAAGGQPTHYVIPGQGGEGGETDTNNFVNRAFVYVSQQSAPNFENSKIGLFEDSTFEIVTYVNGKMVVYLGSYTVNASDTEASLSVARVYSEASNSYSDGVGNWKLGIQKNGVYHLAMPGATVIYNVSDAAPVRQDLPIDQGGQSGDEDKCKVTETQWNAIVVNRGILSLTGNFTMVTSDSSGQTKYEFDGNKVHYLYQTATFATEYFYEFTSLTSGYVYYKGDGGKWTNDDIPADFHLLFDGYIGILPIPFNKVTYNSTSHYYGCSQWSSVGSDGQTDSYQNPRFYFENGNLIKTSYTHWNVDSVYNFSAYGLTSVTLPEVSGGGQQTDDDARYKITSSIWNDMIFDAGLVSIDSNFTAMVTSDDLNGRNQYEFDNGKIHNLYADGYEEYREYSTDTSGKRYLKNDGVWAQSEFGFSDNISITGYMRTLFPLFNDIGNIEFSQLTFNTRTKQYELSSWSYNGGSQFTNISFSFDDNKLMKVTYVVDRISHETEFSKYSTTSVTLPEVGSGGQGQGGEGGQTESKWPAEDIAALLKRLEINATLPALSDETNVESVNPTITADNSGLLITVTYSDARYAFSQLFNYIASDNESFNIDYTRSNISGDDPYAYILVYLNKTSDVMITLSVNQTNKTFIIQVSKFSLPTYPAEDIAKYFEENELENVLPSLEMDNVSYQFAYDTLIMSAKGENTNENIIKGAAALLLKAGFKTMYLDDDDSDEIMPVYVQPSFEYYVGFMEVKGDVWTIIYPCIYLADYTFLSYPNDIISSTRPEDFKDSLPSFDIGQCVYSFYEGYDGYELRIHLQEGMSAESMITTLTQRLARGFTMDDDGVYTSKNGEIFITMENVQDSIIKVVINYNLEEEPPIEEEPFDVEYTLVWDKGSWTKPITDGDAKIYAYVWDNENNHEWIELTPILGEDGTYYFNLTVSNTWTGVKIVRFAPESDIDWQKGDDGSINEGVEIWNESGNYELNGKGGVITFVVR